MTISEVKNDLASKLNVGHINVQCLRNKLNNLEIFAHQQNLHVLCITEYWADVSELNSLNIPNFTLVSAFCRSKHSHGGVAIYINNNVKDTLKPKDIKYVKSFTSETNIELCAVSLCYEQTKINIMTIYRPPTGNFDVFFNNLSHSLQVINKQNPVVIICGDFNIDSLKVSTEKDILDDTFECFNLTSCINEPTRIVTNVNHVISKTGIDYLATNLSEERYLAQTINPCIADHLAQIISCKDFKLIEEKNINFYHARHFSDENIEKLQCMLKKTRWDTIFVENIDEAFGSFIELFMKCIDSSCPLVTHCSNKFKKTDCKNWYTSDLDKEGKELKNLYWLTTNLGDCNLNKLYKEKKKQYSKNIKKAKKEYFSNRINIATNSSREIWSLINEQLNRSAEGKVIKININNVTTANSQTIAEHFGSYFSNVAVEKMMEHFKNNISTECTGCPSIEHTIFLQPTTPEEVIDIIRKLKNKPATGVDGISAKALKFSCEIIAVPLAHLINKCFEQGNFPEIFKIALVLPIFKKGDELDHENYRPISILCVISKVIERIVFNRITSFLNKHKLITKHQHGFQIGKSVETATIQLLQFVYGEMDKRNHVMGLFFDLSKAFDILNVDFIVHKLQRLGIRGLALDLIKSFITGRKLHVKIYGYTSESYDVNQGVPQGSVLGPLIFLLFVNDLPAILQEGLVVMFADDTSMLLSARDPVDLQNKTNSILQAYQKWCHNNTLILNIDKTECVYFSQRRLPSEDLIKILPTENFSESVKFLGTMIDSKLCWDHQIKHICKRLNYAYFALRQLKSIFNIKSLINVYYALAYSHLSYNIVSWGAASSINRVFILQKRLIRLLFGIAPRDSCRPYFKNNKILTIHSIYILNTIKFVKKNLSNFEINSDTHSYNTRQGHLLKTSSYNTTLYKKSPNHAGIKMYNKLPPEIKTINSINKFTSCLKNFLAVNCFYSVEEYMNYELQ